MRYSITYDNESGLVLSMQPITTTTIEIEDEAIYERYAAGDVRARVEDGEVIIDETEMIVEENVVPSQRVAEALGIDQNVGIPKTQLEELAANAGVSLDE